MATSRVSAKATKTAGKLQEAAGDMLDDDDLRGAGQARQFDAALQELCGAACDQVRGTACDLARSVQRNPISAVATAGLVGFALGWLMRRP